MQKKPNQVCDIVKGATMKSVLKPLLLTLRLTSAG